MTKNTLLAAALCSAFLTLSARAQSPAISVKASTLGAGLEIENTLTDNIALRLGANYFSYDYNGTADGIDYDFELELQSFSALLDWHPFGGSFRISAGALYNQNEINAKSDPAASYDIGGSTYTASQVGTLKGTVDFNEIAPYAGIGWDTSFGKDNCFGLLFEVGVIYQGSPKASLRASGPIAGDATFQSELQKEEDSLQDDLDEFQWYPVIAAGLTYRF